ncbi:hypothetical protein FACS1894154_00580 [Betaproteobacteria bacterium]|nr:hypothetical protein FACS1894154_00580 [Betaproteobacteria bacterium]
MKPSIKKASLVAAAIASFPLGAQAAGLGRINVLSGLGQPLQAEIQVNATPQELQSLGAKVASPDAFVLANVPYATFVPSVTVTVENRGNRPVLKLTSSRPVNEPMVGLLLEVTWQEGRLLRTYNFLLDPVDLPIKRPEPIARVAPPIVSAPDAAPLEPLNASGDTPAATAASEAEQSGSALAAAPLPHASTPAAASAGGEGGYTVQRGDTLAKIASTQLSAGGIDLDQALVALYRANPTAFHGGNMNRLRTGAILKLPSNAEVQALDKAEARREVRVQASNFNAYRLKVAENTGYSAPVGGSQAGGGRIGRVVEPSASSGGDKVELTSSGGGNAGTQARLRALEDELAARNASLKEAGERIKELEGIVKLLEVQRPVEQPAGTPSPTPPDAGLVTPPPLTPLPQETPPPVESSTAGASSASPTVEPAAVEPAVVEPPPAAIEPAPPQVASTPRNTVPLPPPPPPEPDLLDTLTDPLVLGAGGGLVALLGGFFGFRAWQRKRSDALLSTGLSTTSSDFPTMGGGGSVFGDNGGQRVDTGSSSSVIHTDFSQTGTGFNIDTSEGVDPVAEADVYMAYGRDTQAEEILNDALKSDPQRGAIYVKLLEIYAQRNNTKQFETTASELYARTQGQGRDWEKAAQLGRKLDPSNPLYGGEGGDGGDGGSGFVAEGNDTTEPEPLQLNAPHETAALSVPPGKGGHSLSGLDFGASLPGGNSSQLKNTVAVHDNMDQLLGATRVVAGGDGGGPVFDLSAGLKDDPFSSTGHDESDASFATTTGIDFDLDSGDAGADDLVVSPTAGMTTTGIDFDLGGSGEEQPKAAAVSTPAPVAARPQAAAPTPAPTPAPAAESDLVASLEFDLPETSQIGTGSAPAFDMNATVIMPMAGAGGGGGEATVDLERTSFDPSALDFDLDLSAAGAPSSAAPQHAPAAPVASAEPVDLAESNETDTKLELARAYQDMGDTEGALDLLREIVAESSGEQKATAQALINELS